MDKQSCYILYRYSQITIILNQPPELGSCKMVINQTFAVISRYDVTCNNWKDPENLGISNYVYSNTGVDSKGQATLSTLASITRSYLSAILPVGETQVLVDICDLLGACTRVSVGITPVDLPSQADFIAADPLSLINQLMQNGDQVTLSMLIKSYNSVLNNASWGQLNENSTANMTAAEIENLLWAMSNATRMQIEAIASTASVSSIGDITACAQSVASALQGVSQSPLAVYTLDMDTRQITMDVLQKMTNNIADVPIVSPTQLEPFMESALDIMTTLMSSGNAVIKNGTRVNPGDKSNAFKYDYDTGLGVNYDSGTGDSLNVVIPTDASAILTQGVLEQSARTYQSQTNQMLDMIQSISTTITKKLVKGQVCAAQTPSGASMLVSLVGEETLSSGLVIESPIEEKAKATFPHNFCPSKYFNPISICRTEFGITVVVWPCITQFYSPTSSLLSYKSRILQSQVSLKNKPVNVAKQKDPILFEIPRDYEVLVVPLAVNVTRDINQVVPLVYHYFNVTLPGAAYTFEMTPVKLNVNYILLIDHLRYPTPNRYMAAYNVSELPYVNGTYSLFVDTDANAGKIGQFIAGIGLVKPGTNISKLKPSDFDKTFNSSYTFRVFVSGCYFYNDTATSWASNEVRVVNASHFLTTCATSHLTGFGTGFIPTPNEVDFNFIIANMGFRDNSTLYAVLILVIVVYILMMIWAHYTDKKDMERRGVIPLPDNKPEDKYLYELSFYTGPDKEAACESNISVVLSGEYGESCVRDLPKPTLNLYRRYDRNTFVMSAPLPLGHLHFLRVYHDNAGRPPYDTWQLERVVIRDLQEHRLYTFETNAWLSFSRDEGLVDRTFGCAENNNEKTNFSQEMYNRTNRDANQDHMWMSMFLRPVGSRYSRKQRVTVCAVFLYLSMLLNAMYYQSSSESGVNAVINVGPIPFTPALILTGLGILLVVYPLVLLLTMIFKRARPKNLKRCRALDAIESQRMDQFVDDGEDEDSAENKSAIEIEMDKEPRTKDKPHAKCLPWWTRILAWILSLLAILVSIFFVWAYGITWGNIKTTKWFSSFFSSFVLSIIVTQWIKIIIMAVCGSVRKTNLVSDDTDCDEELPHLKADETWRKVSVLDPDAVRQVNSIVGVSDADPDIKQLGTKLRKDRNMKFVTRGVIMYLGFLMVLYVIVYDRSDENGYWLKVNMEKTFIVRQHDRPFLEWVSKNTLEYSYF